MRPSRVGRDDSDINKLIQWFSSYNSFPIVTSIMPISNGVIGGEDFNCHLAVAYHASQSGLSLYYQFFTTVNFYLINSNFLQ